MASLLQVTGNICERFIKRFESVCDTLCLCYWLDPSEDDSEKFDFSTN